MLAIAHWLLENGRSLLETTGIVSGLLFTALSFHRDTNSRKVSTLIALTSQHRDIWQELYQKPELRRVLDPNSEIQVIPTQEESTFINMIILQAHCVFRARKLGSLMALDGISKDLGQFFSLPLPAKAWANARQFHDPDFVAFIDASIGDQGQAA